MYQVKYWPRWRQQQNSLCLKFQNFIHCSLISHCSWLFFCLSIQNIIWIDEKYIFLSINIILDKLQTAVVSYKCSYYAQRNLDFKYLSKSCESNALSWYFSCDSLDIFINKYICINITMYNIYIVHSNYVFIYLNIKMHFEYLIVPWPKD